MAIDPAVIGMMLPPVATDIERHSLRMFARAIGESQPVFTDIEAAHAAGYRDLPVPPTFLFTIEFQQPNPFRFLTELGVKTRDLLHGEQSFVYHRVACAGDRLIARPQIADVFTKKGGELEFIVKETEVSANDGASVADLRTVFVNRPAR